MLNDGESNTNSQSEPSEVKTIKCLLHHAGIIDYEPTVIQELLQFMYNHVTNVLKKVMKLSQHANKNQLDITDVLLALKIQRENEAIPISRNLNAELASATNSDPLPEIKEQYGIRLPPDKFCVTNTNFKLKIRPKPNLVAMPLSQSFTRNIPFSSACTENSTVLKRPRPYTNIPEQRIVFRPNLKFNIKQVENEYESVKKPRAN